MKREHKRQIRPHTRSRVGTTPLHVQTLANRDFGGRPSDLERDRKMDEAVLGSESNPAWDGTNDQQPDMDKAASFGRIMGVVNRLRSSDPEEIDDIALEEAKRIVEGNKKFQAAKRGQKAAERGVALQEQLMGKAAEADTVDERLSEMNNDVDDVARKVVEQEERLQQFKGPLGGAAVPKTPTPVGATPPVDQENIKPDSSVVRDAVLGTGAVAPVIGQQVQEQ